jgi:hypothetical protein
MRVERGNLPGGVLKSSWAQTLAAPPPKKNRQLSTRCCRVGSRMLSSSVGLGLRVAVASTAYGLIDIG